MESGESEILKGRISSISRKNRLQVYEMKVDRHLVHWLEKRSA
jgi:hypothetical protein